MVIIPIVGVYIPIIRIPSLKVGGLPSPTTRDNLDHGTYRDDIFHKPIKRPRHQPRRTSWNVMSGFVLNVAQMNGPPCNVGRP